MTWKGWLGLAASWVTASGCGSTVTVFVIDTGELGGNEDTEYTEDTEDTESAGT